MFLTYFTHKYKNKIMNTLKDYIKKHNLSLTEIAKMGINYRTLYSHYSGERNISAESALMYEEKLGIPRHVLRPDLWSDEDNATETR